MAMVGHSGICTDCVIAESPRAAYTAVQSVVDATDWREGSQKNGAIGSCSDVSTVEMLRASDVIRHISFITVGFPVQT